MIWRMIVRMFSDRRLRRDPDTVKARQGAVEMVEATRKNIVDLRDLAADRQRLANATRRYEARLYGPRGR